MVTEKQSGAGTKAVDAYLAAVPEPARSTLEKVRQAIRSAAPGAEEVISYQMPTFKVDGRAVMGFAAWKNFCSIYGYTGTIWELFKDELKEYESSMSKGAIQFPLDKPPPASLIKKIVKTRIKENAARKKP